MNRSNILTKLHGVLLTIIFATGCSKQENNQLPTSQPFEVDVEQIASSKGTPDLLTQSVVFPNTFIDNATKQIEQFHLHSQQLQQAITQFLQNHTEKNWQTLKTNWLNTHESWHLCEFYFTPIHEQQEKFKSLATLLANLHSAPIVAGYLDAVEGYPFSGLVHDITVPVTVQAIMDQHQRYDVSEVAVGLHAIEFFLWGRSASDYDLNNDDNTTTNNDKVNLSLEHQPVFRRRQYLQVLGQLLTRQSLQLSAQWAQLTQPMENETQTTHQPVVLKSIIRQLQQLAPHSEFQNLATNATQYHWQSNAVKQLQQWVTEHDIAPFGENETIKLTEDLKNLLTLFAGSVTDSSALNNQLQAIIHTLKQFSKQEVTE